MNKRKYKIEGQVAKNIGFTENEDGSSIGYTIVVKFTKPLSYFLKEWAYNGRDFHGNKEYEFIPCKTYYDFFDKYIRNERCSHEWDCCGCWNTYFTAAKRVGNKVYFKVTESKNI